MPFSRLEIDVATPRKKPFEVANCGGMDLLVTRSGFKYWRLKYRIADRENSVSLGAYPDVFVGEARFRRAPTRQLPSDGADPSAERKKRFSENRTRKMRQQESSRLGGLSIQACGIVLPTRPAESAELRDFLDTIREVRAEGE